MAETDVPGRPRLEPPVCPRHPDQVSYMRCQRCEQPVCPACQRPAAVGIQCVDCVAAGAATVRQARTIFGREVVTGRPMATIAIIAVCAAVFAAQQADPGLTDSWAFGPPLGGPSLAGAQSAFLHSGMTHLVLNMLALWFMGSYVEPLLGRLRFIVMYLLSAVGGSVGYFSSRLRRRPVRCSGRPASMTAGSAGYVGASGAVFGLFRAVLVLNRHLGRDSSRDVPDHRHQRRLRVHRPEYRLAGASRQAGHRGGRGGALAWCAAPARRRLVWPLLLGLLSVLVLLAALKYAGVPADYR